MISFNTLGNMGRLGNQMFQYAALRGISKNNGHDICIPPYSMFGKYDDNVIHSDSSIYSFTNLNSVNIGMTGNQTRHEKSFLFDEDLFNNCPDNIDLVGYFQNKKYFENIESEIRKEFSFTDYIKNMCSQYVQELSDNEKVISLHIRRGDYLHLSDFHPPLPIDYYIRALEKFENNKVLIFSDDPEWCKSHPLFDSDRFLVSETKNSFLDLCLMTCCNYHIIANSSFSWWGAWLASSEKVVAPSIWFGPSLNHHDTSDIYCTGWEII